MGEDEIRKLIEQTVRKTIDEMRRKGLVRDTQETAYSEASKRLFDYYECGMKDEEVSKALDDLYDDRYFDIIPLYFAKRQTIEQIAERYDVDTSTIVRNKKKLCIEVFLMTEGEER